MRQIVKLLLKNRSDYDGSEQTAWVALPLPSDYMKTALYADRLGMSGDGTVGGRKDEVIAYRSIFGVAPPSETPTGDVECVAECICRFTTEQLESLSAILRAFDLGFMDIDRFVDFLCLAKNLTRYELMQYGIPISIINFDKTEGENDNG